MRRLRFCAEVTPFYVKTFLMIKIRLRYLLFATSSSSRSPRTFGQLLSTSMTTPPCPCCAFVGGDLFLPLTEDDKTSQYSTVAHKEVVTEVVDVMSPADAMKMISNEDHKIVLVDTHGHPHLQRDIEYADVSHPNAPEEGRVVSLTCAVSPLDWKDTLTFASQSQFILPALGIHPWYLNDILAEDNQQEDVEKYLSWDWLKELEQQISQHPNLVVGEIGLCKMARFVREFPMELGGKATALQLQKIVFRKQMELAAKWSRPVTVHCVNMHGSLMEVLTEILHHAIELYNTRESEQTHDDAMSLQEFVRNKFPPSIAMHSFTGTAHHAQEILQFENEILNRHQKSNNKRGSKKRMQAYAEAAAKQSNSNTEHCIFYFGFSHAVNHIMCTSDKARRKGMEAVRAIPLDRLLAESDVHNPADVALGTAGGVAYIAAARGEELTAVADQTAINGLRYLSSLSLKHNV
ncbi:hypothetical protein ACHAWO_008187 [Cyclotella atomus]|uniref:TatD related DNase n=1 Tax=Cyclotella atomus TaxID=382360 RepID=A0ABD3N7L6_9STRA